MNNVTARVRAGNRPLDLVISLSFLPAKSGLGNAIVTLHKEVDLMQMSQNRAGYHSTSLNEIILGNSVQIRRVRGLARTATAARASVLSRGERGTGKNVLATAIHNDGPRRDEPFIFFACASIPPNLMVSELLGFGEGVSENEPWGKPGKFELAQDGTIYFQDIENLTLEAQAILLDALELGIIQHKQNHRPIPVDARVIASSSANLEQLIAEGRFRPDLYYRLSTFEIILPPLRDRIEDLPALAEENLKRISGQVNESYHLTEPALAVLKEYDWPGNLRELEAVLRLATSQVKGQVDILPEQLPEFVFHPSGQEKSSLVMGRVASLQEIEREALIQSARHLRGNMTQMARVLGISRTTLWRKLREFEISVDDFRGPKL
jgi:transcriptional activator for dhaKLM operon